MWLKSHKWVDIPGTRYERRKAMNVRESSHTAMVFDKKYLNVETGKFDTDKLCTLNSTSLNDLVDNYDNTGWINTYVRQAQRDRRQPETNVYNFTKHVPKDNDFDEELARYRKQREIQESIKREKEEYERTIKETKELARIKYHQEEHDRKEHARRLADYELGQRLISKETEGAYAKQLAETEERLLKERNERRERMSDASYLKHTGNVRPNVWKPK